MLKPSLFYLLHNYRLVASERLIWALYYQSLGNWNWSPSFLQILIAFDDSLSTKVMNLREQLGELDEEPLSHLLLDQGLLDESHFEEIRSLQRAFPHLYPGKLLIEQGLLTDEQLERLMLYPYFQVPADSDERPDLVYAALKQMEKRLWLRDYLGRRDAESLGLLEHSHLPKVYLPLAELLVLNGDLSATQLQLLSPKPRRATPVATMLSHPLWNLLQSPGLASEIAAGWTPESADEPLAIRLVNQGVISRSRLSNLILNDCYARLPEIRIQGSRVGDQSTGMISQLKARPSQD